MKKLLLALVLAALPAFAFPQNVYQTWSIVHTPAAASQATISRAAVPGARHVATHVTACVTAVAAQARVLVLLRDGASGAGTVVWAASIAIPAGQNYCATATVNILGSMNTAMTLETSGAIAGTNFASVTLGGYTTH